MTAIIETGGSTVARARSRYRLLSAAAVPSTNAAATQSPRWTRLFAIRRGPVPEPWPRIKRVVEASFAHRRKTLPNSLQLAGLADRERAAAALAAIGRPPAVRAEALEPPEFVALAEQLA